MDQVDVRDAHRSPMPLARLEPTPSGSVRRTTTMEAHADGDWQNGQVVTARGRDLAVDARGVSRALGSEALTCRVDGSGVLRAASDRTVDPLPQWLLDVPARRGLRRRIAVRHPDRLRRAELDLGLLDDLPGIQIISGYAQLHEVLATADSVPLGRPLVGTCAGFAIGGRAATNSADLPDMLSGRPAAPAGTFPDDERVWHREPPATPGGIQRRRLLQVEPTKDGRVAVLAWFRDTFTARDGSQTIVHEYAVDSTVARRTEGLVVERLHARPRVLPLPDCHDAVAHVVRLRDTALDDVDASVRSELSGSAGCTHLNDLLRALRAVPLLIDRLPLVDPVPGTLTMKESTP